MEERKKTGIVLTKGSTISLKKGEEPLKKIAIGLNWGSIRKKEVVTPGIIGKFFGQKETVKYSGPSQSVDLDGSIAIFNGSKHLETVYFGRTKSSDGAIKHSGDDTQGDADGDDGIDNEVISINLSSIRSDATVIYIFLNSYKGQAFDTIPYSKLRVFEGDLKNVDKMLATFNLSSEAEYAGKVTMIMGKLERERNGWQFVAMGNATNNRKIEDTVQYLATL